MKKRALSLFLALLMTAGLLATGALAADEPSFWAVENVATAIEAGLVPEHLQSAYTNAATRAEFCALATALFEKLTGGKIAVGEGVSFTDSTDENVLKMATLEVVNGTNTELGLFEPDVSLTREQAATMLARLANALERPFGAAEATFADVESFSYWAADAIGRVQAAGIMNGEENNLFNPQDDYSREQSIVTMLRMYERFTAQTGGEGGTTTGGEGGTTTGGEGGTTTGGEGGTTTGGEGGTTTGGEGGTTTGGEGGTTTGGEGGTTTGGEGGTTSGGEGGTTTGGEGGTTTGGEGGYIEPGENETVDESLDRADLMGLIPDSLKNNLSATTTRSGFCALIVALYEARTGEAMEVSDVTFTDTDDINVLKVSTLGVITGYPDGSFHPDSTLNRISLAILLDRLAAVMGQPLSMSGLVFEDVDGEESPIMAEAADAVVTSGLMTADDPFFNPSVSCTNEDAILAMLDLYDLIEGR